MLSMKRIQKSLTAADPFIYGISCFLAEKYFNYQKLMLAECGAGLTLRFANVTIYIQFILLIIV